MALARRGTPVTPPSHTTAGARATNERVTYGQHVPGVVRFCRGEVFLLAVSLRRNEDGRCRPRRGAGGTGSARRRAWDRERGTAQFTLGVRSAHLLAGDAHRRAAALSEGQHRVTWGDLEVADSEHARERGSRPEPAAGGAGAHVQGLGSAVLPGDDEGPGGIGHGSGVDGGITWCR
jgi:hypothetical protein